MNVLVCVKHVPDTETRIKITPDGKALDLAGANWIMSPYDEFAVEEALRIKEREGGEVTALTQGDDESVKTLRQALAMGADKAVLCKDQAFACSEPLATARVLAAACKKIPFDLILCGKQGVGDDNQQVPSILAELLGLPCVTVVSGIEYGGGELRCKREIEGGVEQVKVPLPAVISCQKGLNDPRYPSLKGIMAAKKKELATFDAGALGLGIGDVGPDAACFGLVRYDLPEVKAQGRMIQGDPGAQVGELVRLLREEAKAI